MRISLKSDDLPAATRHEAWREMLCDVYLGADGSLPDGFRSTVEGHVFGDHSLTRIFATRHVVTRSPPLIKRDGRELVLFSIALAGRAVAVQDGREAVMERGTVVIVDTTRPFWISVDASADIIVASVPKKPMADRLRGIDDVVAFSLRPRRPVAPVATKLMAGFDEATALGLPVHTVEALTMQLIEVLALSIMAGNAPPKPRLVGFALQ